MATDPDLSRALHRLEAGSRKATPLLGFGLLAIVAGFALLIFYLNQLRTEAEVRAAKWEQKANSIADTLDQARASYLARDMNRTGQLLGAAIQKTEQLAQTASAEPGAPPPQAIVPAPTVVQSGPPGPGPVPSTIRPGTSLAVPTVAISGPRRERPQIVYIQFAGRIARETVTALNGALGDAGWRVEGRSGERTAKAVGVSDVRYHGPEDAEAAEALAAAVNDAKLGVRPVRPRQLDIIKPGVLELWISS